MLFSLFGEISLSIIGLLYIVDCFVDSFINLAQIEKEKEEEEQEKKIPESMKHMYS